MALPPQLNNILARMESIETCPRCGRLVYRKELLEVPEPTATAAAATAEGPPRASAEGAPPASDAASSGEPTSS